MTLRSTLEEEILRFLIVYPETYIDIERKYRERPFDLKFRVVMYPLNGGRNVILQDWTSKYEVCEDVKHKKERELLAEYLAHNIMDA